MKANAGLMLDTFNGLPLATRGSRVQIQASHVPHHALSPIGSVRGRRDLGT